MKEFRKIPLFMAVKLVNKGHVYIYHSQEEGYVKVSQPAYVKTQKEQYYTNLSEEELKKIFPSMIITERS